MKINLAKTPLENLVDLILSANEGTTLTEDQFTTAGPVALAEAVGDLNTSIELRAVLGKGYSSAVTFRYTRLPLNTYLAQPLDSLVLTEEFSGEEEVFNYLVAQLGLMASEVEVLTYTAPVVNDDVGSDVTDGEIVIGAKEGSILYHGTYSLALKGKIDPALNAVFAVTDLDGFKGPEKGEEPQGPIGNIESVSFLPTDYNVVLEENETFGYKVTSVGEGGAALELDILIQNPQGGLRAKEQFTLYADSENPYGDDRAQFEAQQIFAHYADGVWSIDFGPVVTAGLAASGEVKIYASILDVNGMRLWGDMNNVTSDMLTKVNIEFAQPEGEEE